MAGPDRDASPRDVSDGLAFGGILRPVSSVPVYLCSPIIFWLSIPGDIGCSCR